MNKFPGSGRCYLAALIVLFAVVDLNGAEAKPVKALLVTGGCCHDYDAQKRLIPEGVSARANVEWTIIHQGGTGTDARIPLYENKEWHRGFDVVVHNECFAGVTDPEWTQRIITPHREGLGAVVIHCAMHSYRDKTDEWFRFCGVTSHGHGAHYPYTVENLASENPIMKGFGDLWTTPKGELYIISKVWPGVTKLAHARRNTDNQPQLCIWSHEYGKGRVFGTTIGHHAETTAHPVYLEMMTRGILWAARRLEDADLKPATKTAEAPVSKPVNASVNLARGKPATASSEESPRNNMAPHAVDGDSKTRWCARSSAPNEWWQVDLGKAAHVRGCRIHWEANAAYRYRIEASGDGAKWRTIVDRSDNKAIASWTSDKVDAPGTRFLKVTFLGSNTGNWGSFWEFEAYGGDMPPAPKPFASTTSATLVQAGSDPLLQGVRIPSSYTATLYAKPPEITYPTFVEPTPEGPVFISVDENGSLGRDPNRGRIMVCYDDNQDGVGDRFVKFVPNLDSPRGLVWDGEWLYVMHPPHLSAFRDADGDGVSDESRRLVTGIAFGFKDRPADHTSNGITLGIDGWLYLAIGDFGFMKAVGADGRTLQVRGGGIVRVRTDGTQLELYSFGTRNIYEAGVNPFLDAFTRDNTNDGGGWDVRLHHFTGLEHHGYPSLYKHFNEEIIQPLADYGGGSGTGAHYLFEPWFPDRDGDSLYTVDWGTSRIYRHELVRHGATYKEVAQHEFMHLNRATDMDADASGRVYAASWINGQFRFSGHNVGFVVQLTPRGHKPRPFPDLKSRTPAQLAAILSWPSANAQVAAQRELLRRHPEAMPEVEVLAKDPSAPRAARVAALFTLKQAYGEAAHPRLRILARDPVVGEYAVRALADVAGEGSPSDHEILLAALNSPSSRNRLQGVIGMARLKATTQAANLLPLTADPDPVIAHTAVKALVKLGARHVCLKELDSAGGHHAGALLALQAMHGKHTVDGLIQRLEGVPSAGLRQGILKTLARLAQKEGEWKGNSWGTRPDTSGPYFERSRWEETDRIVDTLLGALTHPETDRDRLLAEMARHHITLEGQVPRLLALAQKDREIEPLLVATMLQQGQVPPEARALLATISRSENRNGDLRIEAAQALAETNDEEAYRLAYGVLLAAKQNRIQANARTVNQLHQTITRDKANAKRHPWLLQQTRTEDHATLDLAWSALFPLLQEKGSPPEVSAQLLGVVRGYQGDPDKQVRFLGAITRLRYQAGSDFVFTALNSNDDNVQRAAQAAAKALKLDFSATAAKGPKVDELKPNDVLKGVLRTKGDPSLGEALFARQSCASCHTVRKDDPLKGPYLGNITSVYRRRDLAEAVLTPGKSIAQGFASYEFDLTDGEALTGFVSREGADLVEVRDITGNVHTLKPDQIAKRKRLDSSLMPEGLAANLTIHELASLMAYLESLGQKDQ